MQAMRERFAYDNDIPPVRVLDARLDKKSGLISYKVHTYELKTGAFSIDWMPIDQWRKAVGIV